LNTDLIFYKHRFSKSHHYLRTLRLLSENNFDRPTEKVNVNYLIWKCEVRWYFSLCLINDIYSCYYMKVEKILYSRQTLNYTYGIHSVGTLMETNSAKEVPFSIWIGEEPLKQNPVIYCDATPKSRILWRPLLRNNLPKCAVHTCDRCYSTDTQQFFTVKRFLSNQIVATEDTIVREGVLYPARKICLRG
jgi:hypothetical protein